MPPLALPSAIGCHCLVDCRPTRSRSGAMARCLPWSGAMLLRGQAPQSTPAPTPTGARGSKTTRRSSRRCSTPACGRDDAGHQSLAAHHRGAGQWIGLARTQDGLWLAFDPDLLRVAAVWRGKGVTPTALAPGSYHQPDRKTPAGQKALPEPDGAVSIANGIYPGGRPASDRSLDDPRTPAPSPEEVGRGPIAAELGRFTAVRLTRDGAVLEYEVAGTPVQEWVTASPGRADALVRHFDIAATTRTTWLVLGVTAPGADVSLAAAGAARPVLERLAGPGGGGRPGRAHPAAHRGAPLRRRRVHGGAAPAIALRALPTAPPRAALARRPSRTTHHIGQHPLTHTSWTMCRCRCANPWKRGVRVSDIQFLADGTGVCVTLDGDVWIGAGTGLGRRRRRVAAVRLRTARAAVAGHPRRTDPRLRPQRRLAAARHRRRRRGRPPRAVLERVCADRRHARVPEHHPARPARRVRHRQGRPGSDDDRQAQRQRPAPVGRRAVARPSSATGCASRSWRCIRRPGW